jgi:hypothetical protein
MCRKQERTDERTAIDAGVRTQLSRYRDDGYMRRAEHPEVLETLSDATILVASANAERFVKPVTGFASTLREVSAVFLWKRNVRIDSARVGCVLHQCVTETLGRFRRCDEEVPRLDVASGCGLPRDLHDAFDDIVRYRH